MGEVTVKEGIRGEADSDTVLLIHSDTTDDSTTFVDSSPSGHAITATNGRHDDGQQKFGATSIRLDGGGDYLTVADSTDWEFSNQPFTIDFWFRNESTATSRGVISIASSASSSWEGILVHTASTGLVLYSQSTLASAWDVASAADMGAFGSGWTHYAIVRAAVGGDIKLYNNGTLQTTISTSLSIRDVNTFHIGKRVSEASNGANCWLDEIRISKVARWSSDFTPPARPYSTVNDEFFNDYDKIAATGIGGGQLFLTQPGKLGIGTTAPDSLVEISGVDESQLKVTGASGVEAVIRASATTATIGTESAHNLYIRTANSARITVESGGNTKVHGKLGVGGDPGTTQLLVTGTSAFTNTIHLGTVAGANGGLSWAEMDSTASAIGNHNHMIVAGSLSYTNAAILFRTRSGGSNVDSVLNRDGYLGLGTTTPTNPLQVEYSSTGEAVTDGVRIHNAHGDTNDFASLYFGVHGGTRRRKAAIGLKRLGSFGIGELRFAVDTTDDNADVSFADNTQFLINSDGTHNHIGNRIVNSQTVSDLHRTAEPSLRFGKVAGENGHYVQIGDLDMGVTEDATVEIWFKPDSTATVSGNYNNVFHTVAGASTHNKGIRLEVAGAAGSTYAQIYWGYGSGSGQFGSIQLGAPGDVVIDEWHHAVFTMKKGVSSGTVKTYFNGVNTTTATDQSAKWGTNFDFFTNVRLGQGYQTGTAVRPFGGEIRGFKVHNRALEDTEVAAAYNGNSTPWKYADAGEEEVSNGTFADTSAWTLHQGTNATASISGGKLNVSNSSSSTAWTGASQVLTTTTDRTYKLTLDINVSSGATYLKDNTSGASTIFYSDEALTSSVGTSPTTSTTSAAVTKTYYFKAPAVNPTLLLSRSTSNGNTISFTVDNVSVVAVGEVAAYTPQSINDKWYDTTSNANHGTISGATSVNRPDSYLGDLSVTSDTPIIQLRSTDTTAAADQSLGTIQFYSADTDGTPGVKAEIQGVAKDAHPDGRLSFKTASGGNAPVEHFRIGADGEVQAGNKDVDNLIQVARVHSETITADSTNKIFRITHNLGTRLVVVQVAIKNATNDYRSIEVAHRAGDWLNAAAGTALMNNGPVAAGGLPNYTTLEFVTPPAADIDVTVIG